MKLIPITNPNSNSKEHHKLYINYHTTARRMNWDTENRIQLDKEETKFSVKLLTDTVNKMMKSDFSVCGSLIDDVVDRINDIVSSMDVSDERKSNSGIVPMSRQVDASGLENQHGELPENELFPSFKTLKSSQTSKRGLGCFR
ncbi:unnamed protein product [Brassica oleracea]